MDCNDHQAILGYLDWVVENAICGQIKVSCEYASCRNIYLSRHCRGIEVRVIHSMRAKFPSILLMDIAAHMNGKTMKMRGTKLVALLDVGTPVIKFSIVVRVGLLLIFRSMMRLYFCSKNERLARMEEKLFQLDKENSLKPTWDLTNAWFVILMSMDVGQLPNLSIMSLMSNYAIKLLESLLVLFKLLDVLPLKRRVLLCT